MRPDGRVDVPACQRPGNLQVSAARRRRNLGARPRLGPGNRANVRCSFGRQLRAPLDRPADRQRGSHRPWEHRMAQLSQPSQTTQRAEPLSPGACRAGRLPAWTWVSAVRSRSHPRRASCCGDRDRATVGATTRSRFAMATIRSYSAADLHCAQSCDAYML
jgi:hypothetical protein